MISILSLLLAASCTTIAYCYFSHHSLASRIQHSSHEGTLNKSVSKSISSIPPLVFTGKYRSTYDHASRRVPRQLLPLRKPAELFTLLLRHNMIAFSHFPQAWMIRYNCSSEDRNTFTAAHMQGLGFNEGDLVCGVYRVLVRAGNKVEFMMRKDSFEGRMVISFREEDEDVVFCMETVMWKPVEEETKLPLENSVIRFMHEMAAWWLLDSGVRYLMDLDNDFTPVAEVK